MPVTTTTSGKPPRFDGAKAARLIAALVPGMILDRTDRGIGSDGRPLAPYSPAYRQALADAGEDGKVDLRLTGGLLNSVKARKTEVASDGTRVTVTIAPDTGTSPAVTLLEGRAARTGKRGPSHAVLGYWIHYGRGRAPARPFMGLARDQARKLIDALQRAGVWG